MRQRVRGRRGGAGSGEKGDLPGPSPRQVSQWIAGALMLWTMGQWAYAYGMVIFYLGRYALLGY